MDRILVHFVGSTSQDMVYFWLYPSLSLSWDAISEIWLIELNIRISSLEVRPLTSETFWKLSKRKKPNTAQTPCKNAGVVSRSKQVYCVLLYCGQCDHMLLFTPWRLTRWHKCRLARNISIGNNFLFRVSAAMDDELERGELIFIKRN